MAELVYSQERQRERWAEASDRDVLLAVRAGDEAAFDELIGRKTGPVMQTLLRMVGDREEARDLAQMTFLRVWENRRSYDERWSPNTWIYRIATNLAIDLLRSRGSRARSAEPMRHHLRAVASGGATDLGEVRRREVESIFHELAAELPERQRAAFLLREVEGLPTSQVAEILDCRRSTVRNHLFHARRTLRRELLSRYPEYAPRGAGEEG